MSPNFMAKVEDLRPGVSKNRAQQRQLRIDGHRYSTTQPQKRHEIEAQRRQEALAKPMDNSNKGFSLLSKMGYKPGMALGKQRDDGDDAEQRLTQPIDLQLKLSRTGLGHETMQKEQQVERCEAHMKHMAAKAKMTEELTTDFRKRKRNVAVTRVLIADLVKARKACQELDLRLDLERPTQAHLWPVHKRVVDAEPDETAATSTTFATVAVESQAGGGDKRPKLTVVEERVKYFYSNGVEAEAETAFDEMDEEELQTKLDTVNAYMREKHTYCVWCGCIFENIEEMRNSCPGTTKDDHD